jgi:hypothetical protein
VRSWVGHAGANFYKRSVQGFFHRLRKYMRSGYVER